MEILSLFFLFILNLYAFLFIFIYYFFQLHLTAKKSEICHPLIFLTLKRNAYVKGIGLHFFEKHLRYHRCPYWSF